MSFSRGAEGAMTAWIGLRERVRGIALPLFALPLAPAFLLALVGGNGRLAAGCVAGIAATVLAMRVLRRGRAGDTQRAALVMAGGAFLTTLFAAERGPVLAGLLAGGAWLGTRMLYAQLAEAPPPPAPVPPPPPGPLDAYRVRLARVSALAAERGEPRLTAATRAIGGVLDELQRRPERLSEARRFLGVHLDGLDRIAERLAGGAMAPVTLGPLLDDLARAADDLRGRLQREDTEALEVQVKVLSDRLRQEGY